MEILLIGLFFIGLGLFYLFGKDTLWSMKQWSDEWEGVQSKRTHLWEVNVNIAAILAIVVGIVIVLTQLF